MEHQKNTSFNTISSIHSYQRSFIRRAKEIIEWDLLPHVVDLANHLTGLRNIDDVEIISSCRDSGLLHGLKFKSKG